MTSLTAIDPAGSRHVVLVHGFLNRPGIFWRLNRFLRQQGLQTHVIALRPSSGSCGLVELARQLQAFIGSELPAGARFDLVAFSMGGLVARYYLQRLGGLDHVRRLITISTPHHGTRVAGLLPSLGCVQMRPGSEFLQDLNSDVHRLAALDPLSIYTPLDVTILPPSSSVLPVGRSQRVWVVQHTLMLWSARVLRAVGRELETARDRAL